MKNISQYKLLPLLSLNKTLCYNFQTLLALHTKTSLVVGSEIRRYFNFRFLQLINLLLLFSWTCYLWGNSFVIISKDSFLCIKRMVVVSGSEKFDIYWFSIFFQSINFVFFSSSAVISERIYMGSFPNTHCFVY